MLAKNISIRTLGILAICIVIAATISLGQNSPQTKTQTLTGTWTSTITPPPEAAPPFKLLMTFMDDGNLLATGTGGEFPALGNPCHGTWAKTGSADFAITYVCFDFDGSLQFVGTDKIRGALKIDPTTGKLTGNLDLSHYEQDGTLDFTACCAALEARRLQVERLP